MIEEWISTKQSVNKGNNFFLAPWIKIMIFLRIPLTYCFSREDGGETCNVFWTMNTTSIGFINEQSAVTFYSFIFGFAGTILFL